MKRLGLVLALALCAGCASHADLEEYLGRRLIGDNYGPLFTGETRGEFHDRYQVEDHGYIKEPYHGR